MWLQILAGLLLNIRKGMDGPYFGYDRDRGTGILYLGCQPEVLTLN